MKKVLALIGLFAILGMAVPANAAPPPPAGGHGVHAGYHHRGGHRHCDVPPPRADYGKGNVVVGGVLARRSYWGYPYSYNCRLGWCDDYYYYPPMRDGGVYVNVGFPIRF